MTKPRLESLLCLIILVLSFVVLLKAHLDIQSRNQLELEISNAEVQKLKLQLKISRDIGILLDDVFYTEGRMYGIHRNVTCVKILFVERTEEKWIVTKTYSFGG